MGQKWTITYIKTTACDKAKLKLEVFVRYKYFCIQILTILRAVQMLQDLIKIITFSSEVRAFI